MSKIEQAAAVTTLFVSVYPPDLLSIPNVAVCCVPSVTKTSILKSIQTIHRYHCTTAKLFLKHPVYYITLLYYTTACILLYIEHCTISLQIVIPIVISF
jgi:hypothetical protein